MTHELPSGHGEYAGLGPRRVEALGKLLPIAEAADALRRVAETHAVPDITTLAKLELERHALK